ncbi:MAG: flagellar basal body-associated FliL family protein [Desulfobacterales bacterium]|nr:flagellar basal body-associated FliL family protein [Desulfobacterales bacterium]
MKKNLNILTCFSLILIFFTFLAGCSREPEIGEMVLGGWTNKRGDSHVYLKIKMENKWEASVKIADVTSKIIQVRGKASGKWHIENNSLVLTVFESGVLKVFKKNDTSFFEITKLNDEVMELMDSYGRIITWKAVRPKKGQVNLNIVNSIRMEPFTVNLNKLRSRDKDRYLCLNLKIILKEFMPGADLPKIHPKAREAVLIYLSSLVYKDIKDLETVKGVQGRIKSILNPYIGDMIESVEIDHVIVASTIDRVEEFLIEHSLKARIAKKSDGKDNKEEKVKK